MEDALAPLRVTRPGARPHGAPAHVCTLTVADWGKDRFVWIRDDAQGFVAAHVVREDKTGLTVQRLSNNTQVHE